MITTAQQATTTQQPLSQTSSSSSSIEFSFENMDLVRDYDQKMMRIQRQQRKEVTSTTSSTVSSLTQEPDMLALELMRDAHPVQVAAAVATTKRRRKFTVTPRSNTKNNNANATKTDAICVSFLHPTPDNSRQPQQPIKQIIQRALTTLRPGGVFFVLDYREEDQPAQAASSPRSCCSRAMKQVPEDLVQQWNLTLVPTNLETYYQGRKRPTASLPAQQRIVRWMGIKPARQDSS
jgi:hypothetical protein